MKKIQVHKKAQFIGHNASIYALAKGKDDDHFLSAGGDGWIVEWNIHEPDLGQLRAKTDSQIFSLNHFSDWDLLVAGNMEGGIHFIHSKEKKDVKNIAHHEQGTFSIQSLGDKIVTAGGLGKLTTWDSKNLMPKETLHLSSTSLRCATIFGQKILVGSSDDSIYILDQNLGLIQQIEKAHDNSVFCIDVHPKGNYFISGGRDAHFKVWNFEGKNLFSESAHWFTINDIKFRPDSSIFATASRDKTIRLWDSENFSLLKEINTIKNGGHINSVNRLMWLGNDHFISASDDRSIILWELLSEV